MRTVSVTGRGTALAVPDAASVRVTAAHRASSLVEALAGAESARDAAVGVAGDLVVASAELHVWPAHDQQGRQVGFEARHTLVVECPSVDTAGALLTTLATEVGDRLQVDGVTLRVADPAPYAARAREAAMADARSRAEQLVALAGESLGTVVQIVEGGSIGPVAPAAFAEASMARSADVSLSPGETTIAASVSVTWSFVE